MRPCMLPMQISDDLQIPGTRLQFRPAANIASRPHPKQLIGSLSGHHAKQLARPGESTTEPGNLQRAWARQKWQFIGFLKPCILVEWRVNMPCTVVAEALVVHILSSEAQTFLFKLAASLQEISRPGICSAVSVNAMVALRLCRVCTMPLCPQREPLHMSARRSQHKDTLQSHHALLSL